MWQAVADFFDHLTRADNPLWLYYPLCLVVAVGDAGDVRPGGGLLPGGAVLVSGIPEQP